MPSPVSLRDLLEIYVKTKKSVVEIMGLDYWVKCCMEPGCREQLIYDEMRLSRIATSMAMGSVVRRLHEHDILVCGSSFRKNVIQLLHMLGNEELLAIADNTEAPIALRVIALIELDKRTGWRLGL